jgi:hypothetical protein
VKGLGEERVNLKDLKKGHILTWKSLNFDIM